MIDPIRLSKLISDEYNIRILAASHKIPKSAQELSIKFNIPIAACYRRIHDLEESKLIECKERILNRNGKRVKLYQSLVKGLYLFYENGKLRVRMETTASPATEDETWDALEKLHSPDEI